VRCDGNVHKDDNADGPHWWAVRFGCLPLTAQRENEKARCIGRNDGWTLVSEAARAAYQFTRLK
jgi:hypothetical protein